jgi:opacity protein-like surface antigen
MSVLGDGPLKKVPLFLVMVACISARAYGQANPTADRAGDLQIGLGYTSATSEYLTNTAAPVPNPYFTDRIRGFAFYTDFDFRPHWGAELNFHQLNSPVTGDVYERTYEFGGRYVRHYGRVAPYAKGLYGRGVFNFYQDEANLAYNMLVGGAGIDVAATRRVNIRVDYEYQHWMSFQFSGLNPQLITIGAAYHFGAGKPH